MKFMVSFLCFILFISIASKKLQEKIEEKPKEIEKHPELKEIRIEQGLSQAKLAEIVGVSRNTISSIETGQFSPTAKLALVICIALDKKFEDIFYFD